MAETNVIPIQCPNCGASYQAPVRTVIDVGQNPELREAFLSGQLNIAVCPKCHSGGVLEVPLVYHDPAAEFLAVYFPPQISMPETEKQRMIGELTQSLMRGLPPEQRKGYFLNPRQFINRQSLMDAVLGTMGISQEELDRQRKKMKLVEQFMVMADDPKGLELMVKAQDGLLDHEFFALLASMHERAQAAGDTKSSDRMDLLHENLLPLTTYGKRAVKQQAAVESLKDLKTPQELVDRLIAADQEELVAIAIAARQLLNYEFFQVLTARMEAAQGPERDRLAGLREQLVEMAEKLDQAARQGIQTAVGLLQEIVNSPSPRSALREHVAEIDDLFLNILAMNMEQAEKKGDQALFQRLGMIYDEVMILMEDSLPPEMRFINELLQEGYPEGTRSLLEQRRAEVTPVLLDLMEHMSADLESREDEGLGNTAKRLRDIRAQAALMV